MAVVKRGGGGVSNMFDMNQVLPLQGWTMDTFDEKSKATIEKMLQEEQYPICTEAMYCLCALNV